MWTRIGLQRGDPACNAVAFEAEAVGMTVVAAVYGRRGGVCQRACGELAIIDGNCRVFVRPPLQRELNVASQVVEERVGRRAQVSGQLESVMVVAKVGTLVGEQHSSLGRVEAAKHASRDNDPATTTRPRECDWLVDGQHDQLSCL